MDLLDSLSLLPDERLGPLPWGLDESWGIYDAHVPWFVERGLAILMAAWIAIYVIEVLATSVLVGDFVLTANPRVALAMGCIYRHIDPVLNMIPRLSTCAFLHYNPMVGIEKNHQAHQTLRFVQHIFSNMIAVSGSLVIYQQSLGRMEENQWIMYYLFPLWYSGSLLGSSMSYTARLGTSGSFSIGASGGVYA